MSLYFTIKKAFEEAKVVDLEAFHPQFRFEAATRDPDNDDSLAMRTADPLWMLGRQWQMGEFVGEDNGSPIGAITEYHQRRTNYFSGKPSSAEPVALDGTPLEVQVEAMAIPPEELDFEMRVKMGEQLKRIIRRRHPGQASTLITAAKTLFPLAAEEEMDAESSRFQSLMVRKAIDGAAVLGQVNLIINPLLRKAARELDSWFKAHYQQPPEDEDLQSWESSQLCHKFAVHAKEHKDASSYIALSAPDYQSGHLDWYSFDKPYVDREEGQRIEDQEVVGTSSPENIPTNLSFAAQPNKRLFAFEDRTVDLGSMDIHEDDLIRLMLLDFSLYSGSDWYTLPLEMEMGTICWVKKITVRDVFGVTTEVVNGARTDSSGKSLHSGPSLGKDNTGNQLTGMDIWDVFKIRDELNPEFKLSEHFLYLSPATTGRQESQPLEELLFLRDEFANMVWAIEKRVQNKLGRTVEGFDQHLELNGPFIPPAQQDGSSDQLHDIYRLASTVPANWIPYIPVDVNGKLQRAYMVSNEPNEPFGDITPLSYLAADDLKEVREEAIPKAGVRVQLTKQRVRWTDGKTYIWKGRKVLAGRGEGDSGLRFDYLKD